MFQILFRFIAASNDPLVNRFTFGAQQAAYFIRVVSVIKAQDKSACVSRGLLAIASELTRAQKQIKRLELNGCVLDS